MKKDDEPFSEHGRDSICCWLLLKENRSTIPFAGDGLRAFVADCEGDLRP